MRNTHIGIALIGATVLFAGCAHAPKWLPNGNSPQFPTSRYLSAVGQAPTGKDTGAALDKAESRARAQLSRSILSTIRSRTNTSTNEQRSYGQTTGIQGTEKLQDRIQVASDGTLIGVKRLASYVDTDNHTAYVLVGIDLDQLSQTARNDAQPLRDLAMRITQLATPNDLGHAVVALTDILDNWPKTPSSLLFLEQIAPQRARPILAGLANPDEARGELQKHLQDIQVELHAEENAVRGRPLTLRIRNNAAGLPVEWKILPALPHQAPGALSSNSDTLRVEAAYASPDHTLHIEALLPDHIARFASSKILTSANVPVSGAPPTIRVEVHAHNCGLPQSEIGQIALGCESPGFRMASDDASGAAADAQRMLTVELECEAGSVHSSGDYTYDTRDAQMSVVDRWPGTQIRPRSTSTRLTGAGNDASAAAHSLLASVQKQLCATIARPPAD